MRFDRAFLVGILAQVCLLLGCSTKNPTGLVHPAVSIEEPKEFTDTDTHVKTLEVKAIITPEDSTWKPGVLMMRMTEDKAGKSELANTTLSPKETGNSIHYSERFAYPKKKGKYYLYSTLYEDTAAGSEPRTYEPPVVEFTIQ